MSAAIAPTKSETAFCVSVTLIIHQDAGREVEKIKAAAILAGLDSVTTSIRYAGSHKDAVCNVRGIGTHSQCNALSQYCHENYPMNPIQVKEECQPTK